MRKDANRNKTSTHEKFSFQRQERIKDNKQGDSKEIGYQLKGDLSHMYRFLSRQIIEDIHPQRNMYIQNG